MGLRASKSWLQEMFKNLFGCRFCMILLRFSRHFTTKASELIQEFRDRQEILAQALAELN